MAEATMLDLPSASEEAFTARIDAAFAAMRRICEERNHARCATRKIPREILGMIFRILAESERCNWACRAFEFRRPVTHVCRQWRSASLSDTSIWCNLSGTRGVSLEQFINRSGTRPFTLEIKCSQPIEPLLDALIDTPERLGDLTISDCTNDFLSRLNKPTPRLTALVLCGNLVVPNDFLGGDAPCLRSLHIGRGSIPKSPSWILNLRDLTLSTGWGIHSPPNRRYLVTLSSVLEFIKPLVRLESLHICFDSRQVAPRKPRSPAFSSLFPSLRSINFEFIEQTLHLTDIFKYMETPHLHKLSVKLPDTTDIYDWMGKVQQHFFHATRVPLCRFTLRGWIFSCTATLTSANDEYSLVFPSAHFVAYTIPFTDVQSIETLDISGYELFDFLARVPQSRQYKYLRHIILPPYALCPKHKSIPAAKRWLKAWLPAESVDDVSVGGVKRQPLHDQDLVSLERAIPKVKRIQTGDMRVYYLK